MRYPDLGMDLFDRAANHIVDSLDSNTFTTEGLKKELAEGMRGIFETLANRIPPTKPQTLTEINERWLNGGPEDVTVRQCAMDIGFMVNALSGCTKECKRLSDRTKEVLQANVRLREENEKLKEAQNGRRREDDRGGEGGGPPSDGEAAG